MSWQVRYSERALKQLSKLDKQVLSIIFRKFADA